METIQFYSNLCDAVRPKIVQVRHLFQFGNAKDDKTHHLTEQL